MSEAVMGPVKFLLVDDREENLIALDGLLRREGLVLLKAKSGQEALELLLVHEVALALIDVQMPGMDGFELAELMRGPERTRRVPIMFLTAGDADQQQRHFRGYEAGAVDFLVKPVDAEILRSKADVFYELFRQRQEVAHQRDTLRTIAAENARLLAESRKSQEALQEADRRKDEFLATLAHELRNPLSPIRNGLEILRMSPPGSASAVRAREMMERQLTHMIRLVDDLLDVSRITRGKVELRREVVSVRSLIEVGVEAARPSIEARGHSLNVALPAEELLLHADPTRMAQVMGNLLNNAAKYTPDGGRIELTVTSDDDQSVTISVRDNGIGMTAEVLPRVFDIFTQIDNGVAAQSGLGIGLSIVKRLVEMHGGKVGVTSVGLGLGSTFELCMPLARELEQLTERSQGPQVGSEEDYSVHRVLIVDDNVDAADSLAMMLTAAGCHAVTTYCSRDAIMHARNYQPSVAFLDIGMPEMDGYELARSFRNDSLLSQTILVALTGWGSETDKERSRAAGFDLHLTKPVELERVKALLATIPPKEH